MYLFIITDDTLIQDIMSSDEALYDSSDFNNIYCNIVDLEAE